MFRKLLSAHEIRKSVTICDMGLSNHAYLGETL